MHSQSIPQPPTCLECGAPLVEGLACGEQLRVILAWEWQDPALLSVHFLTVAAYNLQHPAQFTDSAYRSLCSAFIDHLDRGVPVQQLRRHIAHVAAGSQRVRKDPADRRPILRPWSLTIADVYLPDRPDGAADRVNQWAASIRDELLARHGCATPDPSINNPTSV